MCGRDDLFFALHLIMGENIWTSADVMTFFFALHLILSKKLEICRRDDLFFALHLILGGNLEICVRNALFLLFIRFWAEIRTSAYFFFFLLFT